MRVRRFNLGVSFSLFALFFFGVIPLFEYKLGITYNGTSTPGDSAYFTAISLALASSICFYLGYGPRRDRQPDARQLTAPVYFSRRHEQVIYMLTALSIALLMLGIAGYYGFSPADMLFRGYGEEIDSSAIGYSFVNYFMRPMLFNLAMLVGLVRRQEGSTRWPIYLLFIVVMFFVSPIGIPRSLAGALYIPLVTMMLFPRFNSKYSLICIVIFGVLLVAPIFDIFRVFRFGTSVDLAANLNVDYLFAGHFDAFYNLVQVIQTHYRSAGMQMVGAILFWVPRDIWPHKPVGTSFDFATYAGLREGNVSFPLTAELYVDYG
ncbi:MAG: hypothetical protein ACREBW_05170, partial [Candidatus Micrarchaeaceae archaeon]